MDHITPVYPRNQWWVAARPREVTTTPLDRRILNDRIVFYRTEVGKAVALSGLCPHRLYPLAQGRVVGDAIECGYHGFRFRPDGRCSHIPSQDTVPDAVRTRHYPVVEQAFFIWIWTGDPNLADPALIPNLDDWGIGQCGARPGWRVVDHDAIPIAARYTIMLDNLMDLSHLAFIHGRTLPGGAILLKLPVETANKNGRIELTRRGHGLPAGPMERAVFQFEGHINLRSESRYFGPSLIQTGQITDAADIDGTIRHPLYNLAFLHALTPETPTSCHYFVTEARDFAIDNAGFDKDSTRMHHLLSQEDAIACAAVETALQNGDMRQPEISVIADRGGMLVRRALSAQIAGETASAVLV